MKDKRTVNFHGLIIDLQKDGKDLTVSFWKHDPAPPQGVVYFGEITKKEIFDT